MAWSSVSGGSERARHVRETLFSDPAHAHEQTARRPVWSSSTLCRMIVIAPQCQALGCDTQEHLAVSACLEDARTRKRKGWAAQIAAACPERENFFAGHAATPDSTPSNRQAYSRTAACLGLRQPRRSAACPLLIFDHSPTVPPGRHGGASSTTSVSVWWHCTRAAPLPPICLVPPAHAAPPYERLQVGEMALCLCDNTPAISASRFSRRPRPPRGPKREGVRQSVQSAAASSGRRPRYRRWAAWRAGQGLHLSGRCRGARRRRGERPLCAGAAAGRGRAVRAGAAAASVLGVRLLVPLS